MSCLLALTDLPDRVAHVHASNRLVFPSYADAARNTRKAFNPVFCTKPPFFQRDLYIFYFSKFFPESLSFPPKPLCQSEKHSLQHAASKNASGEEFNQRIPCDW